jgi:hypothetical protein
MDTFVQYLLAAVKTSDLANSDWAESECKARTTMSKDSVGHSADWAGWYAGRSTARQASSGTRLRRKARLPASMDLSQSMDVRAAVVAPTKTSRRFIIHAIR